MTWEQKNSISESRCKFSCNFCKKYISGACIILDLPENPDLEDKSVILHNECLLAFEAKEKGLNFRCPKCKGYGKYLKSAFVHSTDDIFKEFFNSLNISQTIKCDLCTGFGFLEKEPIPIIIDWKKG